MKVIDLFPKQKRVVGWNTATGRRTAHSLKKTGIWQEMQADISCCESPFQILKCRLVWALKAEAELWPQDWLEAASDEFDKAVEAIEALAAQQAE